MAEAQGLGLNYGTGRKTLAVYCIGLLLCVILTVIPFSIVMTKKLSVPGTASIIFISAFLQFLVQVIFFLRLNMRTEQGKTNVLSFLLAILMVLIIIVGSLWIMWNLDYNMMH